MSKNATRRALLSSALSLLLCASMLVGTTFAWFTDSVTSTGNIIKSGTLDVSMGWADPADFTGDTTVWKDASAGAIFDYDLWEPGFTQVKYVKIANEGTLAFKYQLNIVPDAASAGAYDLADVIDAYLVPVGEADTRVEADKAMQDYNGTALSALMADPDGAAYGVMLPAGATHATADQVVGSATYCIILHMQETAGNEYQDLSVGDGFSVQLLATQLMYESDSFGPDYDMGSEYDDVYVPASASGSTSVAGKLDADNKLADASVTIGDETGKATFAEGTKLDAGVTELSFKVSPVAAPTADVADDEGVIALNIEVKGLASDNTEPVVITYQTLKNLTDVVVYHEGTAMADGTFNYDPTSGIVTITSAEFSPFDLVFDAYSFISPDKTTVYNTVAEAMDAGEAVMTKDVTLTDKVTVNKSDKFALNLNGYTLYTCSNGKTNPQDAILVKGTLSISNGKIIMKHTGENLGWSAQSTIFDITDGGAVNLSRVEAAHQGGTDMNFVAHLNNWGEVTFTADNCVLKAGYCPVRVFNSGNDMNNVTITNSDLISDGASAFWVHNYTVADFGTQEKADAQAALLNFNEDFFTSNTFKATNDAPIRYGFTNSIRKDGEGVIGVNSADALVAALADGGDVSLTGDIKIDPANMSNAYGTTGLNVLYGQTINGNGHTLDIKGAGGTWDSGINTTGGVIKNLTVTGSFRGIFINHNSTYSERVVLDNVVLEGVTYTISADQAMNQGLTATETTFNGWTSFADTLGDAKFVDCSFGEGNGYAFCRPYAPAEFVGCDFEVGYKLDPVAAVTFENCTIGGEALTADNLATLVVGNIANVTVK